MSVPSFEGLMRPVLSFLAEHGELSRRELSKGLAEALDLSPEALEERVPGGRLTLVDYRTSWALSYLKAAGLVENPTRGLWRVTDPGRSLLADPSVEKVDRGLLARRYPAYVRWREESAAKAKARANAKRLWRGPADPGPLPEGGGEDRSVVRITLEESVRSLEEMLEGELLERVQAAEPEFLERVVVAILIRMGYGGGDSDRGQVTGRSGDGGIDGVIQEDALGLDEVYLQAKRYAAGSNVGEEDLRSFVGAIDSAGTSKGVFVTTSDFTRSARRYAERSRKRIVLIHGRELVRLMRVHKVGVRLRETHEVCVVDRRYFERNGDGDEGWS